MTSSCEWEEMAQRFQARAEQRSHLEAMLDPNVLFPQSTLRAQESDLGSSVKGVP